jgi:xylan 1,4-beta-xylosidase
MSQSVKVQVDAGKWAGKLTHSWNYIGYDECNYTHSPGGMELISKLGKLEKPYYLRTHHMLCTGIGHGFYKWGSTNAYIEDDEGNPIYNFEIINKMCDIWLSNNTKPFFEIGFMPMDLAKPIQAHRLEQAAEML